MIAFNRDVCGHLDQALSREWLETNGLGGFASSSIAGANTRRYHGLLMAATNPPVGRVLLLSKLEETLLIAERRVDLATNEYAGAVHPRGLDFLVGFRLDPFPVFTFECEGVLLEKAVFMPHGQNTTVIAYRLLRAPAKANVELELRPLIAFRDYHSTTHENGALNPALQQEPGLVSVAPYPGLPRLYLAHNAAEVGMPGSWYRNFFYRLEQERGLDAVEDLFNPMMLRFVLSQASDAIVIASTERQDANHAAAYREAELRRRKAIQQAAAADDFARSLALAADQFLVSRGDGSTVIAGYPWFTDWGRDTMIALPGLTLLTGNAHLAKNVLRTFAVHVDRGMLPNRFPDHGEAAEFNTVDATLWYFEAIRAYGAATGDYSLIKNELYPVLTSVLDWHIKGTRYGIRMLDDGLLHAGEPGVQLTWMDAKIGDWVVTPRSGKPVEIQALWYNALNIMEEFAGRFGDAPNQRRCKTVSALLHSTFNRLFWNQSAGCLYDLVDGGAPDASIRPNQIFAVSLPHSMLAPDRARQVVEVVERELLTPVGLRTLNHNSGAYRPRYQGSPLERDAAYHQGTVWPWLLGPFVTAYVKVNGGDVDARRRAEQMMSGLREHLSQAGLGQISEIFDADAPHLPRGCFAQAWSVAEILRAWCEDVLQVRPASPDWRPRTARRQPPNLATGAGET